MDAAIGCIVGHDRKFHPGAAAVLTGPAGIRRTPSKQVANWKSGLEGFNVGHARNRIRHLAANINAVGKGARGDDGKIQPLDVKKGDRILFGKWSGTEIKMDGEELLVMKESDIMGIIE